MENNLIWLAVQEDGRELISTNPDGLCRFSPSKFLADCEDEKRKVVSFDATQETCNIWIENHDPNKTDKMGFAPHWIYVPKGTIKRLIGRDLTWEDEPVKVDSYEEDHLLTREEIANKLAKIEVGKDNVGPIKYFTIVTPTYVYRNVFAAPCVNYVDGTRNYNSSDLADKIFRFGEKNGGVVDVY